MSAPTSAPSANDFLAAFGVEPVEARPQDGYWCYAFDAGRGLTLRFSFCTHDTSVQTRVIVDGRTVSTVSHEGASEIRILDEGRMARIEVTFDSSLALTTHLVVDVLPEVRVTWASLRALP